MQVKDIVWLGTRTARFDEMVAFTENVLGLPADHREKGLAVFELPDGGAFEIFDEEHPGGGHPASGVVGGFFVEDASAAAVELSAAGVEVSAVARAGDYSWAYFKAPDGNLYEVTSGPYRQAATSTAGVERT
jgi:catechol 2,3-dioxygenase-like lactoylglutathione lyase family enzyme